MDSDSDSHHSESAFYYPDEENPKRQTYKHGVKKSTQIFLIK